jgi:hypothetical protein
MTRFGETFTGGRQAVRVVERRPPCWRSPVAEVKGAHAGCRQDLTSFETHRREHAGSLAEKQHSATLFEYRSAFCSLFHLSGDGVV